MDMPERPQPAPPRPQGMLLPVMFVAVIFALGFGGLVFLTQGWMQGVLLIAAGVFAIPIVHYLAWGWWVTWLLKFGDPAENSGPPDRFER